MDGECIFCGESGNWCRCDEQEFTKEADIENLIMIKRYGTCVSTWGNVFLDNNWTLHIDMTDQQHEAAMARIGIDPLSVLLSGAIRAHHSGASWRSSSAVDRGEITDRMWMRLIRVVERIIAGPPNRVVGVSFPPLARPTWTQFVCFVNFKVEISMNQRRVKIPKGSKRKVVAESKCGKKVTVEAQTKRGRLTFFVTASDGVDIRIDNSSNDSIDSTSHGE